MAPLTVVAVAALAVGGCRAADVQPSRSPEPVTSPTVAPAGGPVPFRIQLGAGQRLIPHAPASSGCPGYNTVAYLGSSRTIRLMAYATTCTVEDNERLINGRHGVYRTTADIPADRRAGAVTVQTELGGATVFTQPYSEYTNSTNHYTEPVAVITLAKPADPAYQTLTVVAEKGALPLDQLTNVLKEQLLAP
ncbi:hypothetical protein [Dactylosporangium sp. CA-139066]|uniref:hypothetical protein n=1 Tax=Dactylosporangium sp. CA-139066 TaxID=3239930 RepID=UPI003D8BDBD2